jgi:hypothetical protein
MKRTNVRLTRIKPQILAGNIPLSKNEQRFSVPLASTKPQLERKDLQFLVLQTMFQVRAECLDCWF